MSRTGSKKSFIGLIVFAAAIGAAIILDNTIVFLLSPFIAGAAASLVDLYERAEFPPSWRENSGSSCRSLNRANVWTLDSYRSVSSGWRRRRSLMLHIPGSPERVVDYSCVFEGWNKLGYCIWPWSHSSGNTAGNYVGA